MKKFSAFDVFCAGFSCDGCPFLCKAERRCGMRSMSQQQILNVAFTSNRSERYWEKIRRLHIEVPYGVKMR